MAAALIVLIIFIVLVLVMCVIYNLLKFPQYCIKIPNQLKSPPKQKKVVHQEDLVFLAIPLDESNSGSPSSTRVEESINDKPVDLQNDVPVNVKKKFSFNRKSLKPARYTEVNSLKPAHYAEVNSLKPACYAKVNHSKIFTELPVDAEIEKNQTETDFPPPPPEIIVGNSPIDNYLSDY